MSAAEARASIAYFTFGNAELTQGIYDMYALLKQFGVHVGALYELLGRYEMYVKDGAHERITLYEFLYNTIVVDKINISQSIISSGDSNSTKSPDKLNATNENKRNAPSPDLSDIFRTSVRNSLNGSGLNRSSKSSSSFYASSANKHRTSNSNTPNGSSHRHCDSTDNYAVIDDMLKEAERFEELRQKKIVRRNINSSQNNEAARESKETTSEEKNSEISSFGNSRHGKSTETLCRLSVLNENLSEESENKPARMKNEETLAHRLQSSSQTSEKSSSPIKSSYFTNESISRNRTNGDSKPHPNRIEHTRSRNSTPSKSNNSWHLNSPKSCSSKDFVIQIEEDVSIVRCRSPDIINSSIAFNTSLAETPVKYTQDLFSEDEDMQVDSEGFDGKLNRKTASREKVPKTFENSDKAGKSSLPNEQVLNTQDIFSEDEDVESDSSRRGDTENNNVKQESITRLISNKKNSCDNSVNECAGRSDVSVNNKPNSPSLRNLSTSDASVHNNASIDKMSPNSASLNNTSTNQASVTSTTNTPVRNGSTTNTSAHKETEEVKLFKRIQRNSWADLERSRKDMKCDELEKEIQIMDTSDELCSTVRPNDSPKVRKTDKNQSAARLKNKKITDYFSKEARK